MRTDQRVFTAAIMLILGACEVEFDPRGDFIDRVAAFGALSPQRSLHLIRLTRTYDPPSLNPADYASDNQVGNAVVTITVDTSVTLLRDTTYERDETTRYPDSIRAYVYSPGSLRRGQSYTLTADVAGYGTLTGTTVVPSVGIVEVGIESRTVITNPDINLRDILIYGTPAPNAEASMIRIFLEYEVATLNPGILKKEEVPVITTNYVDCLTYDAAFPQIRRRQQSGGREVWTIPYVSYSRTIQKVLKVNEGHVVSFKRAIAVIVQADRHLYRYYSLVGGFRDEFSIRVDEPNYTNIQNGIGIFGSYTADTLSIPLPAGFPKITCP